MARLGSLLMWLALYKKVTLESTDDPVSAAHRLARLVEAPRLRRGRPTPMDKPFEGTVTEKSFEISRVMDNSRIMGSNLPILFFLPFLRGKVEPHATGSTARLVMRPHLVVAVFAPLIAIGMFVIAVRSLAQEEWSAQGTCLAGMIVIGYLCGRRHFESEARSALGLLEQAGLHLRCAGRGRAGE